MSDIQSRLKSRDDERKAIAYQKKQERDDKKPEGEIGDQFSKECSSRRLKIEELLQTAASLPKDQLSDRFECISKEMQAFQKFVSDSAAFLSSYDLRSSQQQITHLLQEITAKQNQLLPKKFAFKSYRRGGSTPTTTTPVVSEGGTVEPRETKQPEGTKQTDGSRVIAEGDTTLRGTTERQVGFRNQSNCHLTLDCIFGQDVNLSRLTGCHVMLPGAPSTLHMSELSGCTVLCGPASSSVFIDSCTDCTIVVACQQLRVHSTHSSVFYLYVTSRSIIEHCSMLQFAPYNWMYPDIGKHFELSGINSRTNNWDKVDDFLWLSSKEASPNWTILPEAVRVATWTNHETGDKS